MQYETYDSTILQCVVGPGSGPEFPEILKCHDFWDGYDACPENFLLSAVPGLIGTRRCRLDLMAFAQTDVSGWATFQACSNPKPGANLGFLAKAALT